MSLAGGGQAEGEAAVTIAIREPAVRYANFVKLPHTIFALPFALVGVTLASYRAPVSYVALAWVVLAFTAARFAAMGFNRIVDRAYDAKNPRTAMREIPSGTMTVKEAKAHDVIEMVRPRVKAMGRWRKKMFDRVLTDVE